MANLRVYLVGGIQGMTYKECVDWREKVSLELEFHNIETLSPMRGKAFLKKEISIHDSYEQHKLTTKAAIFARDKWDCLRSDIILCNLLGAKNVSIGSMFELAWAQDHGKYIIVVMEDVNPHVHAFVQESASLIVSTLEEAVKHLLVVANCYTEEQVRKLELPDLV
jgi:hypothetical protein